MIVFLVLFYIIFLFGIWGIFLTRRHIIILLVSMELMLLSVNLSFILFSVYLDDILGQLFFLLVLTIAASESAIGLAILVVYYRLRGGIFIDLISQLKG